MSLTPVTTLDQALLVRSLRNSCREFLTNYQRRLGIVQQVRWYFSFYRAAYQSGHYRLYLLRDDRGDRVGYGALALQDTNLLITECVNRQHRGKGYGRAILGELMCIAYSEQRDLIAEIWADNAASIAL